MHHYTFYDQHFAKKGIGVLVVGKADRQHPKTFFFPALGR